ncbi:hypothetical protein ACHQM5_019960 [Ranunculus cassubicifolius]
MKMLKLNLAKLRLRSFLVLKLVPLKDSLRRKLSPKEVSSKASFVINVYSKFVYFDKCLQFYYFIFRHKVLKSIKRRSHPILRKRDLQRIQGVMIKVLKRRNRLGCIVVISILHSKEIKCNEKQITVLVGEESKG